MLIRRGDRISYSKTILLGTAAGLSGAWVMTQFTRLWKILLPCTEKSETPPIPFSQEEWDSTSAIAEGIASPLLGRALSLREKKTGAVIVHYVVGGAGGAVYATLARRSTAITWGRGAFFGFAVWLFANELLMPVLGVTDKLGRYAWRQQANSLGEHLVYAFTTDALYRRAGSRLG